MKTNQAKKKLVGHVVENKKRSQSLRQMDIISFWIFFSSVNLFISTRKFGNQIFFGQLFLKTFLFRQNFLGKVYEGKILSFNLFSPAFACTLVQDSLR